MSNMLNGKLYLASKISYYRGILSILEAYRDKKPIQYYKPKHDYPTEKDWWDFDYNNNEFDFSGISEYRVKP